MDEPDGHADAPQVLASTGALLLQPLGWAMEVMADAGFGGVEVVLSHQRHSRDPDVVAGFARQAGLDVPVVHGPYMLVLRRVLGSDYRRKTRASLQLAAAFGARTMVAHAPFRWEQRARGWLRDGEAEAAADDAGVTFAMENLFPVAGRAFSSAITLDDLAPYPHVVFDTSHFAVAGIDLFDAWAALGDRVVHLHLSDNLGTGSDNHAPLGSGTLPLASFLAHVAESGYVGTVTLELDCRPHLHSRGALVGFLADEREKAEAMLTVGRRRRVHADRAAASTPPPEEPGDEDDAALTPSGA